MLHRYLARCFFFFSLISQVFYLNIAVGDHPEGAVPLVIGELISLGGLQDVVEAVELTSRHRATALFNHLFFIVVLCIE